MSDPTSNTQLKFAVIEQIFGIHDKPDFKVSILDTIFLLEDVKFSQNERYEIIHGMQAYQKAIDSIPAYDTFKANVWLCGFIRFINRFDLTNKGFRTKKIRTIVTELIKELKYHF